MERGPPLGAGSIASGPREKSVLTTETSVQETPAWHSLAVDEVVARSDLDLSAGLTSAEAAGRLAQYGPNELEEEAKEPVWRALLRQYRDFMQLLLLGAGMISLLIDQASTAVLLFALTVLNAAFGYRQEAKAEESVAALKEMMQVQARVRRNAAIEEVPSETLVPGDVVMIEAGDVVPADGRVVRSAALEIEESALTGESHPSPKDPAPVIGDEVPLGDRSSMAYMSTLVTRGTGTLLITGTGMSTEMGRIAGMLTDLETQRSPLQRQMDDLAKVFAWLAGGAILLMVAAGLVRGMDRDALFLLAITVAIGAIPTGLPTIVTTLLSIGTRRLAEAGAIVKDLTSVETLGSTTAICSDKTGTLTLNQMTVRTIAYGGAVFRVEGQGYAANGPIQHVAGLEDVSLEPVLVPVSLCSDAVVNGGVLVGDPTEGALVTAAAKGGVDVIGTRETYPRIAEVPFDSAYKFMATFHEWTADDGTEVVRCFVKGAPTAVMDRSAELEWGEGPIPMEDAAQRVGEANDRLAGEGLRVIAVAQRDISRDTFDAEGELIDLVVGLDLMGLFGIVDPPRPEAAVAIEDAKGAGVRVRMITGDNAVTASAIADEIGIEGEAITGVQLDHMGDEEFADRVDEIGVFGRVAPEHKVRLVTTLQGNGEVVAMTGDGVNDAPALKAADIGVAMGITGTEVSKQAARMVLTDDDFATIVKAVYLGRVIYDNLMKYVRFQMSSLVSFISTFVGATLLNIAMGAPLSPLQILWVNFVITGVLAIALGFDTPTPGLMSQPPRSPNAPIMDRGRSVRITIIGLTMGIVTLAATVLGPDEAEFGLASVSGTMALTTLSLAHIVAALTNRYEFQTVFRRDAWDNPTLIKAMGATAAAAVLVTEIGFLQRWFDTVPLSAGEWAVCIAGALIVLAVDEVRKAIGRARSPEYARRRAQRAAAMSKA